MKRKKHLGSELEVGRQIKYLTHDGGIFQFALSSRAVGQILLWPTGSFCSLTSTCFLLLFLSLLLFGCFELKLADDGTSDHSQDPTGHHLLLGGWNDIVWREYLL